MMRCDDHGGFEFAVRAPSASVVELTVDFGSDLVRTLGMRRGEDGTWSVRLHGIGPGWRYRFRVDGRSVPEPDSPAEQPEGWTMIARAA